MRTFIGRPYYGSSSKFKPAAREIGANINALAGSLGALGGTLGCLLCLAAVGALGLFSCVVALTAYTKQFLDQYKIVENLNGTSVQVQIGFILLYISLFSTILCRIQRN